MGKLTEAKVRNAQLRAPHQKFSRYADGDGLSLFIKQSGVKEWRYRFRIAGRETMASLGRWPEVTLRQAREKLIDARRLVASGVNPAAQRRAQRAAYADSFAAVAKEWLDKRAAKLAPATLVREQWLLDDHLLPRLGGKPVASIKPSDVLDALKPLEARKKLPALHRARQLASRVFRYAIVRGRATYNAAADLSEAFASHQATNRAALTEPAKVGELLRAIDGYDGQATTICALRLLPYLFVRPGELRQARWPEFDLDRAEWRIPAARMKMRDAHLVPLPTQAVALLRELQPLTAHRGFVFPAIGAGDRPISENTLNAALRRLGYSTVDEITAHGFRAMASTLLNEQGYAPDVIELQLAHRDRNKVRAVYNRAQRLEERRTMMQAWADYLDGLKAASSRKPTAPTEAAEPKEPAPTPTAMHSQSRRRRASRGKLARPSQRRRKE